MDKILSNLGLCQKSGGVIAGEELVIESVRAEKVFLIFLANDAGFNTTKKIKDKANYYGVEVDESYSSLELSNAIGKSGRMVLGITNKNFLKILKK
ncbi:MAG: ribosomal L7Ae/L30e/S12e/Gadd45 family protein [Acholeplasmatales bacterium]|nr:ribosomal L7Ae/L30e/S12e/Gadd45 family protein [Acholeplasmatales bacterium]